MRRLQKILDLFQEKTIYCSFIGKRKGEDGRGKERIGGKGFEGEEWIVKRKERIEEEREDGRREEIIGGKERFSGRRVDCKKEREDRRGKRGWERKNRLLVGKEDQDGRAKKYLEADKESLKEGK
jgi:hypothetical protein